ncbi:MAG TPA: hypothetical protein VGY58_03310 [Gemmataceae bacterium]|nr:hypothetical protein [Gemmataceae bacterium]
MHLLKTWLQSRVVFCVLLALAMVGCRVAIFDGCFFRLETLPNHDVSQGIAFFATNMHSVRLSGEIAWWNPSTWNGYAQHYQSFLAPFAPTPHHVVFIVWSQLIRILAVVGYAIPEYYQYLTITYLLLPFLTYFALALFASFLLQRRTAVLLVVILYTFSGIGLWNSAWFYFQESCTLFFLLAACVAALRRPTPRRLWLLAAALLVQATSVNYWTFYNAFFITIVLGSYCGIHPNQVRRLWRRAVMLMRRHRLRSATVALLTVTLLGAWWVMLHSIVAAQKDAFLRRVEGNSFSIEEAYALHQDMRTFTLELFNPTVAEHTDVVAMHRARYIGCAVLPLLLPIIVRRWRRQDRWLLCAAAGTFIVCLAPPWLLQLWKALPMMDHVRHIFRFYTHHWQLMIVLLAGVGFDTLLRGNFAPVLRLRFLWALGGLGVCLTLLLIVATGLPALPGNLAFIVLTLIAVVLLFQMVWSNERRRVSFCAALLVVFAFSDLTRFFWEISRQDTSFTHAFFHYPDPMPEHVRLRLGQCWSNPDLTRGFEAGLPDNLPITNSVWPINSYLPTRHRMEVQPIWKLFGPNQFLDGPPLELYKEAVVAETPERAEELIGGHRELLHDRRVLLLQAKAGSATTALPQAAFAQKPPPQLASAMTQWTYNGCRLKTSIPEDGWLYIHQIHDRRWSLALDGKQVWPARANFAGMAIPIQKGDHVLHLDYRPKARGMYSWACALLEGTLLTLFVFAARDRMKQASRLAPAIEYLARAA